MRGYIRAEYGLGLSYTFGQGVPQSPPPKALSWLKKVTAQGGPWEKLAQQDIDFIKQRRSSESPLGMRRFPLLPSL